MFKVYPGKPVGLNAMSVDVFIERITLADQYIQPIKSRKDFEIWRTRFHNLFSGLSPDKLAVIQTLSVEQSMAVVLKMLAMPGGENLERENPIRAAF